MCAGSRPEHAVVHDYACFGLRIRSLIALPELGLAPAPSSRAVVPDVSITFGAVPADLPHTHGGGGNFQVGDGEVLLRAAGTARYLIRGGRDIIVDIDPLASAERVRLFLLGSAFGILCHQRGLLPLHANAIVTQGGVVAFAGASGAGKSTLAAYFQKAGYEVLCDDVCALSFDANGRPLAWPGLPRLRLWRDAASTFGHDDERSQPVIHGTEKYHVPFAHSVGAGPFPFQRLYLLQVAEPRSMTDIAPLRGADAYTAILLQTYRHQYLAPMGLRRRHLDQSAALLQNAKVYRAPRGWGFDIFAREAEKLERHFQAM